MAAHGSAARRWRFLVIGLLLALVLAGAATAGAESTGIIKVKVEYPDAGGIFHPLARVEVFLWAGDGTHYACTNGKGVATFTDVPAGGGIFAATGVGVSSLHCDNGEFLTPGTHLKLYSKGQGGIALAADQTKMITFQLDPPPADQMWVCGGEEPTMTGTPGRDVLVGSADRDIISAGDGNDTIKGMGGNDILCGGPGRDRILGGGGNDLIFGEAGNDMDNLPLPPTLLKGLFGGPGTDYVYGGYGTDYCEGETALGCEYD
jgi:Ca2+-binding RTX toxin-like protein